MRESAHPSSGELTIKFSETSQLLSLGHLKLTTVKVFVNACLLSHLVMSDCLRPCKEGLLEKTMALHSSTLAWKIPWMEEPGRLQSWGHYELDTNERLHFHFSFSCIREGNGNSLQCSCLENPRDGGRLWGRTESDMT